MIGPVAIVGAGRAGRAIARALRAAGVPVCALIARRPPAEDDADAAVVGDVAALCRDAAVVLLAVQDAALPAAVRLVADAALPPATVVLQLSGSAGADALAPVRERGHPAGTFHPLLPLAAPERAADALRGAWVGTGGDATAVRSAEALAVAIGARTMAIPTNDDGRAQYHAAAVLVSNFPSVLAAIAERLLGNAGVARPTARDVVWQLMRAAVANLHDRDPAAAITGPIARGDVATVQRHLRALGDSPGALAVYRPLSQGAVDLLRERLGTAVAAEFDRLLADDGVPSHDPNRT